MKVFIVPFLLLVCIINLALSVQPVRIYITSNQNVKFEMNGIFVYDSRYHYFSNNFDLTESLGYTDWDAFTRDYKYFKSAGCRAEFHRHDHNEGNIERSSILEKFELKSACLYTSNIEESDNGGSQVVPIGGSKTNTYPVAGSLEWDFGIAGVRIFDQSIKYQWTYHQCQIRVLLQKYVKNGHLMLRSVYSIRLDSAGSTVGSTVDMFTGDYVEFYN